MRNFIAVFFTTDDQEQLSCRTDFFQNSSFCRIVTVQFFNHFLSVQYYSISQPFDCWLKFTDIRTYLKRTTFDVYQF